MLEEAGLGGFLFDGSSGRNILMLLSGEQSSTQIILIFP